MRWEKQPSAPASHTAPHAGQIQAATRFQPVAKKQRLRATCRLWPFSYLLLLCFCCFLSTAGAETLVIGTSYSNQDFQKILKDFAAEADVQIEAVFIDTDKLKTELLQRASRNLLPDAVIIPADILSIKNIPFREIPDDWISTQTAAKFRDQGRVNRTTLGIPIFAGNHLLLYFNRKLIERPATSWEELRMQAASLPDGIDGIGWSYQEMYWFVPFLAAFDGLPLVDGEIHLDGIGMQQTLEFYWNLSRSGLVDDHCNYPCVSGRFERGELAYAIDGFWAYGRMKSHLQGNFGVAPLPAIGGRQLKSYSSVYVLAFTNPDRSTAWKEIKIHELANFFQSERVQATLWDKANTLPVHRGAQQRVLSTADADLSAALRQLDSSMAMPIDAKMPIVWEAMSIGFSRYGARMMDAPTAGRFMQHLAKKSADGIND